MNQYKKFITKVQKNLKLVILTITLIALFCGDVAIIIIDQFVGEEKGVVFHVKLFDLIFYSNLAIIGFLLFIYLLSVVIEYSKVIRRILQNLAFSIISFLIIIFLIELVFFSIRKLTYKPVPYDVFENYLFRFDPLLGYTLNNNITSKYDKILVGSIKDKPNDTTYIFRTTIRTDSIGNRLINIPGMLDRKKYAIFFGCSFTFGLGVEDSQTIPYYFAKYDTNFCSYNFAIGGYGPQNMLVKLHYNDLKKTIKQDSGVCFYIYMGGHPARVIGDMLIITTFGKNLPYYGYKHDSLYHFGSFSRNRWFISGFYTLMSKSNFINYYNINFPFELKPKDYILTYDIIYKSYLEYKKQFHNNNFYVVLYPASSNIKEYLKKYDIKILDFTQLFNTKDKRYYLSIYDHHPTPLAHEIFAKHLINTINNIDKKQ